MPRDSGRGRRAQSETERNSLISVGVTLTDQALSSRRSQHLSGGSQNKCVALSLSFTWALGTRNRVMRFSLRKLRTRPPGRSPVAGFQCRAGRGQVDAKEATAGMTLNSAKFAKEGDAFQRSHGSTLQLIGTLRTRRPAITRSRPRFANRNS